MWKKARQQLHIGTSEAKVKTLQMCMKLLNTQHILWIVICQDETHSINLNAMPGATFCLRNG
jgi:hypothetical protein